MKRLTSSTLTIVLAAGVLVLGGIGATVAATGGTFLLGKTNSATTLTSLTNSQGTALSLNTKAGTAPLKVNSSTKVNNLNADLFDGLNSTSFQRHVSGSCATGIDHLGLTGAAVCTTPTTIYNSAGNHDYTVPAQVTWLDVRIWGGGGGAWQSSSVALPNPFSGSGGGQGGYLEVLVPVQPGDVLSADLGAGGTGEGVGSPVTDGGASTLSLLGNVVGTAAGGLHATQPDNSTCSSHGGGGAGGAAGALGSNTNATGLASAAGAAGQDGYATCAATQPGGAGGGHGFGGAGGSGYPSDTFFQGGPGADGMVLITPVG